MSDLMHNQGMIDGVEDDMAFDRVRLTSVPFLPQRYHFRCANLVVDIRNIYRHEDNEAFDLWKASAQLGEGLDDHAIPTLAVFRRLILCLRPCVVMEDVEQRRMIGWFAVSPCSFTRSSRAKYGEVDCVFAKDYQV